MAMDKKIFTTPIIKANPITVLVLGICSALAVTVKLEPAILIRKTIPNRIRIIVQLVVVAMFVILISEFLKAYVYDVSKQLSVYVGLIITNCIIMGRIEAFGLTEKPLPSLVDGLANGLGYGLVLVIIAFFRELIGSGSIFGAQIIPQSWYEAGYMNNGLFIMPPMALILIGCLIWIQRSFQKDDDKK